MKLWELRSYEEVIRMEQDRLIYETRLRARYGRSWRRKAPVEALMPLKLTHYGKPLTQTAPSGLAAAELPSDSLTVLPRPSSAQQHHGPSPDARRDGAQDPDDGGQEELAAEILAEPEAADDRKAVPHQAARGLAGSFRTSSPSAAEAEGMVSPLEDGDGDIPEDGPENRRENGAEDDRQADENTRIPPILLTAEKSLTLVDRYYQAWADLTTRLGSEPRLQELSDHLWVHGMAGRGGGPISPSTLRRYRLGWRIYRVWEAHLETQGGEPSLSELEALCAKHGIKTKGNRGDRLDERALAGHLDEFRRRYAATSTQPL
jgi:hypothetical protein